MAMDTYDLAHKLAYAGRRSPVPFITGPEFTNSVPGVPVLSELRIFIAREQWSEENVMVAAREICRVLGPSAQFDIGITSADRTEYGSNLAAAGSVARLMKLEPKDSTVTLRFRSGEGDRLFQARFPRLLFEPAGEDYWRSVFATGAVKPPTQE